MNSLRSLLLSTLVAGSLIAITGCRAMNGAEGGTPAEQRTTIQDQRTATLNELYAARPETRSKIQNAAGYGFFSNVNVNLLVVSSENGYGVVHDNQTGKDTYMKMGSAGVGLGAGLKDYRAVFVFNDPDMMHKFVNSGWDFGGQADAAAKTGEQGASTGASATAAGGLEVYQFTKSGIALQATVQGTKYWCDAELNQ
jgi:lipid-binding SYLF domain-containing protein